MERKEIKNTNAEALIVEEDRAKGTDQIQEYGLTSAHTIDHDSWQQVGLMLVTSFNCGYILSYSNLLLVPLGWVWGILGMCVVGLYTAYASWLLAGFHFINGQRFIRYRDLMGFLYGREMFYVTWVFQFSTIILGNMGFILLGGRALKEINSEFSNTPLEATVFHRHHRSHLLHICSFGSNYVGNGKVVGNLNHRYFQLHCDFSNYNSERWEI